MKSFHLFRRSIASAVCLSLALLLVIPASAFPWSKSSHPPYVADFSKSGLIGTIISFEAADFVIKKENSATLNSIRILTLPDPGSGTLTMGGQPLTENTVVDYSALAGLRFQSAPNPSVTKTSFTFLPSFSSGQDSKPTTVTISLLQKKNETPIARNMDLSTYKNIAITGYFDAVDTEGDPLSFQLMSSPARGAVTMAEDGSSQFVYTPYENKTGHDTFTYVAIDPAGNISPEASVTISIEKANTQVTYSDLDGHSAHKSAIRLAEEGIYGGQYWGGKYFFDADAPVSRAQFLSLAMAVSGLEPLEGVTMTGFSDDDAIPTWAKGSVSAALKAGVIQGSKNSQGAPIFGASTPVTWGEASVMLDRMLNITDVPLEVFSSEEISHWAAQSAANLAVSGVTHSDSLHPSALSAPLTRGEAAQLLDGALNLIDDRNDGNWLFR